MSKLVELGYAEPNDKESTSSNYQIRICPSKRQSLYDNMTKPVKTESSKRLDESYTQYDKYDNIRCDDDIARSLVSFEEYDKIYDNQTPVKTEPVILSYCHNLSYAKNDSSNQDSVIGSDGSVILSYERGENNGQKNLRKKSIGMNNPIQIGSRVQTSKGTQGTVTEILEGKYLLASGKRIRAESIAQVFPPETEQHYIYVGKRYLAYAGLILKLHPDLRDGVQRCFIKPDGYFTTWLYWAEVKAVKVY